MRGELLIFDTNQQFATETCADVSAEGHRVAAYREIRPLKVDSWYSRFSGVLRIGGSRDYSCPEALDGERKTVTALFADIKGSTELMRDLDPEEAARAPPALVLFATDRRRLPNWEVGRIKYDGLSILKTRKA